MSDSATAELIHHTRQLTDVMKGLLIQQRIATPQWMTGAELKKRWKCNDRELHDMLISGIRYNGKKGQPIRVHIDDVLKMDAIVFTKRSVGAL
jgi:hypothetical protein